MSFKRHTGKIMMGLVVLVLLARWPVGRQFIRWLLPFGSGPDDVLFFFALGLFAILAFARGWIEIPYMFRKDKER